MKDLFAKLEAFIEAHSVMTSPRRRSSSISPTGGCMVGLDNDAAP
jgi:hypothetical protein